MLRPAAEADRDRVLAWRNHPQVRAVSLTQHEITPAEHAAWAQVGALILNLSEFVTRS